MRRAHADLIHAWAEGAEIEYQDERGYWHIDSRPSFSTYMTYRIKPEKKPDVVRLYFVNGIGMSHQAARDEPYNLKLTFSGDTGELIKAEVL